MSKESIEKKESKTYIEDMGNKSEKKEEFNGEFNNEFFVNSNTLFSYQDKNELSNKHDYEDDEHIKDDEDALEDDINNKNILTFLSSDLYSQLNSGDKKKDEITLDNNNFYLTEQNGENSDQEDLMLIQEENSEPNKLFGHQDAKDYETYEENFSSHNKLGLKYSPHNFSNDKLDKLDTGEEFFKGDATFLQIKKQMNINQKNIPKIPSYPARLNTLKNKSCNSLYASNTNLAGMNHKMKASPQINLNESNSSFQGINNLSFSSHNLQSFIPNNSFTMNGKNGWVCPSCKNFNYEMRTKCNRCGRAQMIYQNPMFGSHGNLHQMETLNLLQLNNNVQNSKGSHLNLNNAFKNYNFGGQSPTLSPLKGQVQPQKGRNENQKKKKPFVEREGDWVCSKCQNLNFAFRTNCNRCRMPKDETCIKNVKQSQTGGQEAQQKSEEKSKKKKEKEE